MAEAVDKIEAITETAAKDDAPEDVVVDEGKKEAALVLEESKSALQLRYLQTLNAISTEQSSTIVFPFPIDTLCISMGAEKDKEKEKTLEKKKDKKSD